jgi:hypothetical protein
MVPSVARERTLHCKLDSKWHWAAVKSIIEDGGKWIMEVPVNIIGKADNHLAGVNISDGKWKSRSKELT